MKTDRELLELAAKAAGLSGYIHEWINGPEFIVPGENPVTWNPLADDGDALRLAVRLGMLQTHTQAHARFAMFYACCLDNDMRPSEAARCAIVSAAAEIGKAIA